MTVRNYPKLAYISAITNEVTPTVTFTANHDFTVGEIVAFRVGKLFGMFEIDKKRSKVKSITSDTVVIGIDTSTWGVFSLANLDKPNTTPPHCVPSSSGPLDNQAIPRTNIQDAFDKRDIS